MAEFYDVLREDQVRYLANRVINEPRQLGQLFPDQVVGSLTIQMIKGSNQVPVTAHIHSFDTQTELADYESAEVDYAELMLIKRAYHIGERLLIDLNNTSSDRVKEDIKREIFNHTKILVESILTRIEAMCGEIIQTGKLKINENGYVGEIDYHMPKSNLVTGDWSTPEADPLKDIYNWMDVVYESSSTYPTRALTRQKTLRALLSNMNVRKAVLGTNADRYLTQSEFNAFAQAHDLPVIGTYEGKYRDQLPSGKKVVKKFISDKSFILLPSEPVGYTYFGPTAEYIELTKDKSVDVTQSEKVTVSIKREFDSPARNIKASATALVTAPYIDQVLCATVTTPEK